MSLGWFGCHVDINWGSFRLNWAICNYYFPNVSFHLCLFSIMGPMGRMDPLIDHEAWSSALVLLCPVVFDPFLKRRGRDLLVDVHR